MKKPLVLAVLATSILLTSCGSDTSTDDSSEQCKSLGGKEVDCEDLENTKKLDKLSLGFVTGTTTDYAEGIRANEVILEKMKPLMSSLENIIKADPAEKEEYYVQEIEEAEANVASWKQILKDLELISITANWEQDPVYPKEMDLAVRFENKTSSDISYLGGKMTYLDAEGNVIVDGDIEFHPFNFEPKGESMAPGYEGFSDHGLNMTKEQRATISTITLEIDEIRYTEEDEY
jgi:hypothetical protein